MSRWESIKSVRQAFVDGKTSAVAAVERALARIDETTEFHAILSTMPERALERARALDADRAAGKQLGKLAGVPFVAKDNFLTFGGETTAASNILKGFKAPYQATAIERLEAEGAICVAKANLDAFAHGSSTENSDFGPTKNPHDLSRVPGGSSGGSVAAVMLDIVPFALGSDTGGSIRQPASFCGAVGYKPTYGLVSRSGVVAMASSLDTIGPIARSVADAALVLECMAGIDPLDSTSISADPAGYEPQAQDLKGVKVGLIAEYMSQGLDEGVRQSIMSAVDDMKARGADIVEVSLPSLPLALAVYYILCPAEVSSNLSRYDGQRYGYSEPAAHNLDESYELSREHGFGAEAKRRIMLGTYVLSSGYYDAYYRKAATVRTKLINEFAAVFSQVDFLVGPTTPTVAFPLGAHSEDPLQMYLSDIMTVAINLVGIPAICVPARPVDGLPVGLQLLAPAGHDRQLLALAQEVTEVIHA
jgi:aspartyl-tRNA(Asn)/glutamyl-tRNA(Gln) amidotransferase subunit A